MKTLLKIYHRITKSNIKYFLELSFFHLKNRIRLYFKHVRYSWRKYVKLFVPPIFIEMYRSKKNYIASRKLPDNIQDAINNNEKIDINLCCGPVILDDYINIDISAGADITIDLEKELLPFDNNNVSSLVCMSAINYFTAERALLIIKDVYRVLKPGGITRFGVQDLRVLAEKYLSRDHDFFYQINEDGQSRFPGKTYGDKFNHFFYGFENIEHKHCKYVYDFESLKNLFEEAGFKQVEEKKYRESLISNISEIDNRPRQMFYLEAVKDGSSETLLEQGISLWESGKKEQAWQFFLKSMEIDGTNRLAVLKILDILKELGYYDFAVSLLTKYLTEVHEDHELEKELNEIKKIVATQSVEHNQIIGDKSKYDYYNERRNLVYSDKEHLKESINWLKFAANINNDGGVSSYYDVYTQKWGASYPETTGYIIPTLLCYAKFTGEQSFSDLAIKMGDWEIKIQSVEGGAGEPIGVYLPKPRVFNTGQVMLGWLSLYKETKDKKYLNALIKASNFLIRNIDIDGQWINYTFMGESKAYKSRVIWALLEVYLITENIEYQRAAESVISWILRQAKDNGWFHYNGFVNAKPITHLIGYNLVGLLEIYRLRNCNCDYDDIMRLLTNAANNIVTYYKSEQLPNYSGLPASFDSNWNSNDEWSCITGDAQIAFFLRRLYKYNDNPEYLNVSNQLINSIKSIHLIDDIVDDNLRGGIFGSYPIGADYCPYQIPNWGVKFFADTLLQNLMNENDLYCLS